MCFIMHCALKKWNILHINYKTELGLKVIKVSEQLFHIALLFADYAINDKIEKSDQHLYE